MTQLRLIPDATAEAADLGDGIALFRNALDETTQGLCLDLVAGVAAAAPFYRATTPRGPFSCDMTNCGAVGWYSDQAGYRYAETHPTTGQPWPAIPPLLKALAQKHALLAGAGPFDPDVCLVNRYPPGAKMGQHQDHDEADFRWPIVSFSFGASARFALGGRTRKDAVQRIMLRAGDVLVMYDAGRMRFHGVDRILDEGAGAAHPILPPDHRLNLTFRRAR
ncbi:alpha-ketoglutarate-dependent dioxygenase AlkB [Zavarzinia sp. CC-PAN008]|uniref:alpha-ketoglutarate-dependent dioxygenase AlkB n=1 Tax=Zavarzinia sp. CC-PAN008 TaxID=3243332 RepID=UPI003F749B8A